MKDIFDAKVTQELIKRINNLEPNTLPYWGTMSADQMLAHCNVTYEMVYDNKHKKPNTFAKLMLKLFVKRTVINDKPYKKNSRTAPQFLIMRKMDFDKEKTRLINYLSKTQDLGADHFDGKPSHSFGKLTKEEWNNMFYKHLDHHLTQFRV